VNSKDDEFVFRIADNDSVPSPSAQIDLGRLDGGAE
jgi:hypothetical protein